MRVLDEKEAKEYVSEKEFQMRQPEEVFAEEGREFLAYPFCFVTFVTYDRGICGLRVLGMFWS